MPLDMGRLSEILRVLGATMQDTGAGLGGRQGGNVALLEEIKRKRKLEEAQRLYGQRVTQAMQPQVQNFPSPTGPGNSSPMMGQTSRTPTMQSLAPLFAEGLGQGYDVGPQMQLAQMLQPKAPEEYTLGQDQARFRDGRQIAQGPQKAPEGFSLSEGQTRFGADGKPIANVQKSPATPNLTDLIIAGPDGQPMINPLAVEARRRIAEAGRSQININQAPTGYVDAPTADDPSGLRPRTGGPADPYRPTPPNEAQAAAGGFADRAKMAQAVITKHASTGTSTYNRAMEGGAIGNYVVSNDAQLREQAERDFLNAVLRRESGAVISPEEFKNGQRQYFPQPGDGAAVLEQKRKNRDTSVQGLQRSAGPSYKPPDDEPDPGGAPAPGTVEEGYRFKGGNPADPNAWERVS